MDLEKRARLVGVIFDKTKKGLLDWSPTADPDSFQISFATQSVVISHNGFEDEYYLGVYNSNAELIEQITPSEIKEYIQSPNSLFQQLFENARSKALKVDDAIDNLLDELGIK